MGKQSVCPALTKVPNPAPFNCHFSLMIDSVILEQCQDQLIAGMTTEHFLRLFGIVYSCPSAEIYIKMVLPYLSLSTT